MSATAPRPAGVTLVAVLTWISGVLSLIGGVVLVLLRDNADVQTSVDGSSSVVLTVGIVSIIVGLITIAVANGLRRGSGFARALVTLLMLLNIAGGIWVVIKLPTQGVSAWINIAISVIVIIMLFTARANAFFRSH